MVEQVLLLQTVWADEHTVIVLCFESNLLKDFSMLDFELKMGHHCHYVLLMAVFHIVEFATKIKCAFIFMLPWDFFGSVFFEQYF